MVSRTWQFRRDRKENFELGGKMLVYTLIGAYVISQRRRFENFRKKRFRQAVPGERLSVGFGGNLNDLKLRFIKGQCLTYQDSKIDVALLEPGYVYDIEYGDPVRISGVTYEGQADGKFTFRRGKAYIFLDPSAQCKTKVVKKVV